MLYPRLTKTGKLVEELQMVDCEEHLLSKHRIFFLNGLIVNAVEYYAWMLALSSLSHDPIRIIITSPGGDLDSAFLLYDTMCLIKSPIETLGRYCASAAAMILAAGKKRYLMPHAKVMLHLPAGQMTGDSREWEIQHTQMIKYKNKMVDILVECGAKKSHNEILADMDRDFWLEPEEAIAYGLADEIMTPEVMEKWLKQGDERNCPIKVSG